MLEQLSQYSDKAMDWTIWGLIHKEGKGFSHLHNIQTGSGDHATSCSIGYGGYCPWGKVARE